jgi:ABC-type bacteriocin/lantibiotic exporter with double-glycine peptidase domain
VRRIRVWWVAVAIVAGAGGASIVAAASPVPSEPVARMWTWSVGGTYLGRETVRVQEGAWDCGIAALSMVFEAHGREAELAAIRGKVLGRGEGLSLLEMEEIADGRGLPADGWRLDFAALRATPLPAIAHFADHYVVVDRISAGGTVRVRDPAVGLVDYPRGSFERLWTGVVLVFPRPSIPSK